MHPPTLQKNSRLTCSLLNTSSLSLLFRFILFTVQGYKKKAKNDPPPHTHFPPPTKLPMYELLGNAPPRKKLGKEIRRVWGKDANYRSGVHLSGTVCLSRMHRPNLSSPEEENAFLSLPLVIPARSETSKLHNTSGVA